MTPIQIPSWCLIFKNLIKTTCSVVHVHVYHVTSSSSLENRTTVYYADLSLNWFDEMTDRNIYGAVHFVDTKGGRERKKFVDQAVTGAMDCWYDKLEEGLVEIDPR